MIKNIFVLSALAFGSTLAYAVPKASTGFCTSTVDANTTSIHLSLGASEAALKVCNSLKTDLGSSHCSIASTACTVSLADTDGSVSLDVQISSRGRASFDCAVAILSHSLEENLETTLSGPCVSEEITLQLGKRAQTINRQSPLGVSWIMRLGTGVIEVISAVASYASTPPPTINASILNTLASAAMTIQQNSAVGYHVLSLPVDGGTINLVVDGVSDGENILPWFTAETLGTLLIASYRTLAQQSSAGGEVVQFAAAGTTGTLLRITMKV